jgi:hypothetical protein
MKVLACLTFSLFVLLLFSCEPSQRRIVEQPAHTPLYYHFIDSISNDSLFIIHETSGCEHYYTEVVSIYKHNDSLFAELSTSIPGRKETPSFIRSILNDSSLFSYYDFESEIKSRKEDSMCGCTTSSKYKILFKESAFSFEDNCCKYGGFYDLKCALLGEKRIAEYHSKVFN